MNTIEVEKSRGQNSHVLCSVRSVGRIPGRKVFSYNKRTMDRAMVPLWRFLESISCVLSIPRTVRLPPLPQISRLLSIAYRHILISYNSILRRRVLRRAALTVFLLADQKTNRRPIIPGTNSWEEMDARFSHCHSWAGSIVSSCLTIRESGPSFTTSASVGTDPGAIVPICPSRTNELDRCS